MKEILLYILLGIAVAVGGMFISALTGMFFNGMEYGDACVLGICIYLCVVIVACTGIIIKKINEHAHAEERQDKQRDL